MKFEGKQLIPYITAGDPDLATTSAYLDVLEKSTVKIVELGIPFSDPLADGPVIQASHQRAIASGTNLRKVFEMLVKRPHSDSSLQIVLMLDYNLLVHHGIDAFVSDCINAGIAGILSPNCPLEDPHGLAEKLKQADIANVRLVSQNTSPERLELITQKSSGFIYVLSTSGVTGTREQLDNSAQQTVQKLRAITTIPLCVGFGISTAQQVKEVLGYADGAIVGSALVKHLQNHPSSVFALQEWITLAFENP